MKLAMWLLVIAGWVALLFLGFDQTARRYRVVGAQEYARLQGKDKPIEPESENCLLLFASVNKRRYKISAENICHHRTALTELLVKFYNSEGVRIGVASGLLETLAISPMDAGEKMSHELDIPTDVLKQKTAAVSAKAEVAKKEMVLRPTTSIR